MFAPTRAIIADDHPIYRSGIRQLLGQPYPQMTISEAGSYDEVLNSASQGAAPGLFILDLCFPGMEPRTTIPQLRKKYPRASLIIVSMNDDSDTIKRVHSFGVDGFISKAASSEQLLDGVNKVLAGEFVSIGPDTKLNVLDFLALQYPGLTKRHHEVISCLIEGKSNKEIGLELGVSPFTIRLHVSAILMEMGVTSRTAVANIAARYRQAR
jgi:DNA-binding NarL/FixJ family response regulator